MDNIQRMCPNNTCLFLFGSGGIDNERRKCGNHSTEVKVIGSGHAAGGECVKVHPYDLEQIGDQSL